MLNFITIIKRRGAVELALVLFVAGLALTVITIIAASALNRLGLSGNVGDAHNAAETCLAAADYFVSQAAQGADPFQNSSCVAGSFVSLTGSPQCFADRAASANTTIALGADCSCAVTLDSKNATTYTISSIGRCFLPGGTRQDNYINEVVLSTSIATGTPFCSAGSANCCAAPGTAPGAACLPDICGGLAQTCNVTTCLCE